MAYLQPDNAFDKESIDFMTSGDDSRMKSESLEPSMTSRSSSSSSSSSSSRNAENGKSRKTIQHIFSKICSSKRLTAFCDSCM